MFILNVALLMYVTLETLKTKILTNSNWQHHNQPHTILTFHWASSLLLFTHELQGWKLTFWATCHISRWFWKSTSYSISTSQHQQLLEISSVVNALILKHNYLHIWDVLFYYILCIACFRFIKYRGKMKYHWIKNAINMHCL